MRISDWSSDVCSSDLNISVYRKLHLFGDEQRFIAIATAGNLSVTQSTLSKLEEGVLNPETGTLKRSLRCPHCFGRCSLWGVYFATRDTKQVADWRPRVFRSEQP